MTTAWVFPGQGSQQVGMGRDLFQGSPRARAVFEAADQALGRSLSRLCFEGPEAELTLTQNTQPAIFTHSVAALEAIREAYPALEPPALAAGHSLGEYSALLAAGALALGDALRLLDLRGRAMQEAVPEGQGGMAAILGGDRAAVLALCENASDGEVLEPANFNAPGQIVISGARAAVDRAIAQSSALGLKAIALKVSAPFHCSLMKPAALEVERALRDINVDRLHFPVVCNVEARPNADPARVQELLVRQIDAPVLWQESIRCMAEAGVTRVLEIGPGRVLANLIRRIQPELAVLSVGDPATVAKVGDFLSQ